MSKLMALRRLYRMGSPKASSKSEALATYKARTNHKKMPKLKEKKHDQSDYKKMSIEEYEKKYG